MYAVSNNGWEKYYFSRILQKEKTTVQKGKDIHRTDKRKAGACYSAEGGSGEWKTDLIEGNGIFLIRSYII